MLKKYQAIRATKRGSFIAGTVALMFLFVFGTWAIDSGSLWHWGLAFFFLFDAVFSYVNIFRVQNAKPNVKKQRSKKTA